MKMTILEPGGISCRVFVKENPEFLLLQPVDKRDLDSLSEEASMIEAGTDRSFVFCAFAVDDWNRDLSPWEAEPVFGDEPFGCCAGETLSKIGDVIIPQIRSAVPEAGSIPIILGGYSLAGLFSLWCGYETDAFDVIVSASPSVWFPGWIEYAKAHDPKAKCIYLSLGDKEEKTRNKLMSTVGDCIKVQHEILEKKSIKTTLEWNPGNHFKDVYLRLAKGFLWAMENGGFER